MKEIGRITITIFDTGAINVNGFPNDAIKSMEILNAAQLAIVDHFMKRVDKKEPNKIITLN